MILVDTSAWVDFFRGNGPMAPRVDDLLDTGEVAVCGPIITELRRGLRSKRDRSLVLPLLAGCAELTQPLRLWEEAGDLGHALARKGVTVKSLDLLIAAYALSHSLPILSGDADFAAMARVGIGLLVA